MKYLPALAVVCLLIVPPVALAQQISPNPNPAGNTITVNSLGWFNNQDFLNQGVVDILTNGALENNNILNSTFLKNKGTLNNDGTLNNYFWLGNYHELTNNAWRTLANKGVLVNELGGELYNKGLLDNTGELYNKGLLDNGGTLTNEGVLDNDDTLTNNGWLTNAGVLNNTRASVESGSTLLNNGTLTNESGGTLNNNFAIQNNGTLTNESGGTLNNNFIIQNHGTLTNESGGTLNNFIIQNHGTLTNESGGTLNNNLIIANHATLNNSGMLNNESYLENYSGSTLNNNHTLTNNDGGTLTNNGTLNNEGTLTNDGSLDNQTGGQLTNTGTLFNGVHGDLRNNGTIDTTNGTFTNNGYVHGSGRIIGSYTDHGITKPGNSAGVMTIDGDYFKVEGSIEIELGGLFNGGEDISLTEFDWIDVTGNVELAGLLQVELIDGFELHRGNWFDILRVGGTLSGQYEGLGEGALVGNFGGQDLFITYGGTGDGGGVALFTNAVPEPTTVLIWSMLAGLGMTVRRRR